MEDHHEDFLDIQHLLQEYIVYYYLHHNFYEVFIKFKHLFSQLKPLAGKF